MKMKWIHPITCTAIAAFLLSGCVTRADGSRGPGKTVAYGLGSAATCGVVGALLGGEKSARNAALACGVIGAGVGGYMDYQEAKLRESLKNTPVQVSREGNLIKLTMPSSVTFAVNSAGINRVALQSLHVAAETLVQYPETDIIVAGHTDNTGSLAINRPLSERRAQSVADYLVQRGVAAARIRTQAYADSRPVASNATEAGREQNRRVEILIQPTARAGQ